MRYYFLDEGVTRNLVVYSGVACDAAAFDQGRRWRSGTELGMIVCCRHLEEAVQAYFHAYEDADYCIVHK